MPKIAKFVPTKPEAKELSKRFPKVDPGFSPPGDRIIVQLRGALDKSPAGLQYDSRTQWSQLYNENVAKVIALGVNAFKFNDAKGSPWPEGSWYEAGDYVLVPKCRTDKIIVGGVHFLALKCYEIIGVINGNPLAITNAELEGK